MQLKTRVQWLLLFTGLSCICFKGSAQIKARVVAEAPDFQVSVLDTSQQIVFYDYQFRFSPKSFQKLKAQTALRIGNSYTQFTDYFRYKKDSLKRLYHHLNAIHNKEVNALFRAEKQQKFNKTIIKNLSENSLTCLANLKTLRGYRFAMEFPEFNWKLSDSTKNILGHICYKATGQYGGRTWVAWYDPSIAIAAGPYVFGELPGLILEVYDRANNFHFSATAIQQAAKPIYKQMNYVQTVEQADYFETEKRFHHNPSAFNQRYSSTPLPYFPIEVEI